MGEVLSQSEIDSLLNALSSGELDAEDIKATNEVQVRNYDFARPSKFSKEHLRTLEIIYEHYGRLLSTNLPLYLRKNVSVTTASAETVVFSEFSNALSNPVILGVVDFAPLKGSMMIELSPNIGFAIIDRMLGGKGLPIDKTREFSDIELVIIEKIMVLCMQLMKDPWKNVVDINPILERIETNPQFAQIIAPNDMIAIVTLNVTIGEVDGIMNICLPFFTIEGVIEKLNTKFWYSRMKDNDEEDFSGYVESLIRRAEVPVTAYLGKSVITVNDFAGLQCGDIIRLDTKADEPLPVYVGNIKKFLAAPGKNGDKYACRVTSVIREEE
ncbi:MAG: flagellar motor switch protein FliM [Lachnospiraceae bacterium]|nr:flagellar motor switch protein FliM [Lachnospiraceae bacterium]